MDINTLHRNEEDKEIGLNDIGRISIRTTKPLFFDSYRRNRNTGSIILIDEATNETVNRYDYIKLITLKKPLDFRVVF